MQSATGSALRARILCQQGRFTEAVPHWRDACLADPASDQARRGLELAEKLAHSPIGGLRLHARLWALAFAVLAVLAGAAWGTMSRTAPGPSARELLDSISQLQGQIADLKKDSEAASKDLITRLGKSEDDAKRSRSETQTQLNRIRRSVADLKNNLARP
jgi:hypothetical protein